MNDEVGFDLTTRPWIRVRDHDGSVVEVSLLELFEKAHSYIGLAGELPTQDVAVLRLLLAILRRSHPEARTYEDWGRLWERGRFAPEPVATYLTRHRDRFDLLHPQAPFYQVAGLRTAKGEVGRLGQLVADVPSRHAYFTTRSGPAVARMTYAEAARWLLHANSFDVSGIKTGTLGDPEVKGGKSYPMGIGWCGWLGLVTVEGGNLFRTLMLNLTLGRGLARADSDLSAWERPTPSPEQPRRTSPPEGPADLLTWQSRRILLAHDGQQVTGAVLTNGDPLHPRNRFEETMTGWRLSEAQMKALKSADPIFMPRSHLPDRAVWRGLASLLAPTDGTKRTRSGRWREWLAELREEEVLGDDVPLRLRATGMLYGAQSSVTDDVVDDPLLLHLAVLSDPTLMGLATDAVGLVDDGVRALGRLASELAYAGGGSRDLCTAARDRAQEQGYAALDAPYRRWVGGLGTDSDRDTALRAIQITVKDEVTTLGEQLVESALVTAWSGRTSEDGKWTVNAATATNRFRATLRKALPAAHPSRQDQEQPA